MSSACPICGKPVPAATSPRLRPFCSPRCAQVDLGRWFTGAYAVPAAPGDAEDGSGDARDDDGEGLDPSPALR